MTQKCCAHTTVEHDTVPGTLNGTVQDIWRCADCQHEFEPVPRSSAKAAKGLCEQLKKLKR
jgi:hypothetical protein